MDLGSHGEEMPMPIATQFGAIHEAAAKLKLLAATTTTSGNGTQPQQVDALDVKAGVAGPGPGGPGPAVPAISMAATPPPPTTTTTSKRVRYRECLKNHAASIGGHALDGCGEFMPCGEEGSVEALKCAACECHRNFHRREVEGEPSCDCYRYKKRASSALLLPGGGRAEGEEGGGASPYTTPQHSTPGSMKKRFRTKFTPEQKEKMLNFADKLGWRIQKHDEAEVQQFVNEVGVKRHVLKVWMHNNKHTLGKKG